jgi:hypothetical protein
MKIVGTFAKLGLGFVFAAAVWAQAVSQIQGTVQDSTGATVPGAEVKATQTATGTVRTTTSAADGNYVLPNLPIGPYSIEVTKQGFTKYVQTGITLQVATSPTIDISLKVGAVTESVQVEANATLVETQNTGIGGVMDTSVIELPLNGRNSADLIAMVGAAVNTGAAGGASSRSMNGGVGYSVAGGQSYGVSYQLDGSLHNNPFDNLNLPLPFPDALQEFKVETSSLTAQNGMHSAAAVNAVTKSGTNEFHGDAFEFLRNGAVNGHAYFSHIADNLKRNQYGGTVGGPIKKNKLFVFGAYQGTKTRQFVPDNSAFIPTAKELTGDFNGCATLKAPAVNNVLDPNTFSKASLKLLQKLNMVGPAPCGFTTFGIATATNEYQIVGRSDYQISDKQTLFGRYMATTFFQPPPYTLDANLLNTIQGGRDNLAQSFTLGDTYLISPTTVNSFRATVNRTAIQRTNADFFSAPDLGVQIFSYMPHYLIETMTSGFNIGGGTENAANFRTTTYQLSDDVNLIRGSHQFAFGATLNQWRSAGYANVRSPGTFTFSGAQTGNGLADFLLGDLSGTTSSYLQSAPNTLIAQQWYLGVYAQDTWKVTPRLTVNYGVRWEPWFPQQVTNNAVYNFDFAKFAAGQKSTVFKNAPAGFTFPGDAGFDGQGGMNKRWSNFGPRVGVAWDPKGDGKLSIRASYGLAYDFVNGQFFINTSNAPPWGSETRITGVVPFDAPFSTGVANIFPVSFDVNAPFSLAGPFIALKPNTKNPGVHSWNLSIQKQVGTAWLFSASYLGNETQHLWVSTAGNPGVFGPGATAANLQARRVLSLTGNPDAKFIGFLDFFDDGGTQSYNGLLLSATRRLSRGVSLNANYTWSHCIGDFTQGGQTPNVGTGFIDPNNRRYDRGPCSGSTSYSSDRRHIFNLTAVAETPKFSNNVTRMLATGWKFSGIYRAYSGAPLNVTTTVDVLQTGAGGQRPNIVGDPYGTGLSQYLILSAFPAAAPGTLGNLGRFALVGPTYWDIDMAVSRAFRIRERQTLEVRAEAFNLSNSLHEGNPTTNINSALFGQITSTYSNSNGTGPQAGSSLNDSRVMQFAMKYVF